MGFINNLLKRIVMLSMAIAMVFMASLSPASADPSASFHGLFHQGVEAYQRREYQQAIDRFTDAIEQDPSPPNAKLAAAYSNRCLVHLELNHYPQAIADCTQSIRLNPANVESYLNRGLAQYRAGNYPAAIADYNQLLDHAPEDYRAWYNRGLAQFELQHYDAAIADYDQSIQYSPELSPERMAEIYDDRGIAYLLLDKHEEAIADFSQAIAHVMSDTRAYFNRGCAFHRVGNEVAALRDFNRVLAIDPTHAETYFNLGMVHYQLGQLDGAIARFHQAAYHFYAQEKMGGYDRVMTILKQLQNRFAFG